MSSSHPKVAVDGDAPPPAPSLPPFVGSFAGLRSSNIPSVRPPTVPAHGPPGATLVELLTYNGYPFKDHWAYFVQSQGDPDLGVVLHATGDVINGFSLEFKRSTDLKATDDLPSSRIPLQWVDGRFFNEKAMFNNGPTVDSIPVCIFESSVSKVNAPEKSLNSVDTAPSSRTAVKQRNCQTWIIESADQLVKDGIFSAETASYLRGAEQ
ncbi:hypothetical protein VFPPC_03789 [Pochonia chlamydosporia 170]|uniref:Uncharacterized protein n=1 Tax=Pochonia chlamydosporia 170 TaxID=1380566 RepID=A0A179F358_METCM|nr:hypothetical protein VFPPC_03789 [Pochonia chlamydosporia 170]OAQ59559.1 hypothetical protein VFPPC_03789 [Pochonia chlamydosporia 170]